MSSLESWSSVKVDWGENPGSKIVAVEELFVSLFDLSYLYIFVEFCLCTQMKSLFIKFPKVFKFLKSFQ